MYEVGVSSNGIILIPNFVKMSELVQKLKRGHTDNMVMS
jgi:hypothetical protein